ncbi:MAG TPA: hypothetical protein VK673_02065 [Chthoniobacterales bacterium]|nr:hypothetical protein [Chthoniobacterales bacterium]
MRNDGRGEETDHHRSPDLAAFKRSHVAAPITVHVTPDHIRQAAERRKRRNYDPGADCPVCIAVDEVLHPISSGRRRKLVYVTADNIQWFYARAMYRQFELPAEAKLFVRRYDNGESVKEFSFRLTEYQDKHIFSSAIGGFPRVDDQGNVSIWFESV